MISWRQAEQAGVDFPAPWLCSDFLVRVQPPPPFIRMSIFFSIFFPISAVGFLRSALWCFNSSRLLFRSAAGHPLWRDASEPVRMRLVRFIAALWQSWEMASRKAHNLDYAGSIPASATSGIHPQEWTVDFAYRSTSALVGVFFVYKANPLLSEV